MPRNRSSGRLAGVCAALLVLHGPAARAQSSPREAAVTDSLDILGQAREAQRDFEQARRAGLPTAFDEGAARCDERIGRYCYWYDPFADAVPEEPKAIGRARERLLHDLAAAASRLPGDGWIAGQLVRYLAEHGLHDSAVTTARRCRAARWWCAALEGFARHLAQDYERADVAFARALGAMPEAPRCAWTDLGTLLGDAGKRYRKLSCGERYSVDERIWWLARPLYSRPGNDLRTEHYARQVMALLLQDAATPDGLGWGADARELIVRFGWPSHWSRSLDRFGSLGPPPILGHEPSPSFWLFPAPVLVEPWADVTKVRWAVDVERPPARYAPPYAVGFAPIERVQFARFRRRDGTLTVAAFDLTTDSVLGARPADVRLATARDPATPAAIGRVRPVGPGGIVAVRSPWRPAVLSLEAVGVDTAWVARRRAMAPPDPGALPPVISDVLLFAPTDVLPESLKAALPVAFRAPMAPVGGRVGLYWEMYGELAAEEPVDVTVTAMELDSRDDTPYPVGRPSCPAGAESPVRLRWREEPGARPRGPGRAVALDLRALREGDYVVSIQVSVAGRTRGCSSRELRVGTDE